MSDELKHLIVSMLQLDPAHRPTMSEILAHPWMRGDLPSKEEVIAELKHRKMQMDQVIEAEREAKRV